MPVIWRGIFWSVAACSSQPSLQDTLYTPSCHSPASAPLALESLGCPVAAQLFGRTASFPYLPISRSLLFSQVSHPLLTPLHTFSPTIDALAHLLGSIVPKLFRTREPSQVQYLAEVGHGCSEAARRFLAGWPRECLASERQK